MALTNGTLVLVVVLLIGFVSYAAWRNIKRAIEYRDKEAPKHEEVTQAEIDGYEWNGYIPSDRDPYEVWEKMQ